MGMGKSLSEKLLKEGCRVVLVDINAVKLKKTQAELSKIGKCTHYICDISDRKKVYQLAQKVEKEFGHVDILVDRKSVVWGKSVC